MGIKDSFTYQEWETLQFSPFWVFGAVAGADQDIDEKEVEALTKEITDALRFTEPLVREILMSVMVDFADIMEQFKRDSRDLVTGIQDVASVLDRKATLEQAKGFKGALLLIGTNVAKASGTTIFRRDPVSDEEKAAIVLVAHLLKVSL